MIATKEEIIEALKVVLDECRGDKAVEVPVLFLEDVYDALTEVEGHCISASAILYNTATEETHEASESIPMNYCPGCGRKWSE